MGWVGTDAEDLFSFSNPHIGARQKLRSLGQLKCAGLRFRTSQARDEVMRKLQAWDEVLRKLQTRLKRSGAPSFEA